MSSEGVITNSNKHGKDNVVTDELSRRDEEVVELASMEVNDGTLVELSDPEGVLNTGKVGGRPDDDCSCASASRWSSERGRGPGLWETLTEGGRPFLKGRV